MIVYNVTDKLAPTKPLIPLNLNKVLYIIIHHAQAQNCTWQDINAWHKQNTWACAGYNEFINKAGDCFVLRGDNIGAQCENFNSKSYGIGLEGDFNIEENVNMTQYTALIDRIRYNMYRFPNLVGVIPHSQIVKTDCPGKYFPMSYVLRDVSNVMDLNQSIEKLVKYGVINSPDYWKNSLQMDFMTTNYIKILIKNMALKLA